MAKVALITGITGQDGSYLAELLLHANTVTACFRLLRREAMQLVTRDLVRVRRAASHED